MTDLTDRMRTCAAHILATMPDEIDVKVRVSRHAADLLIEAAAELDKPAPAPEPPTIWPLLEEKPVPSLKPKPPAAPFEATWVDPGVPELPRVEPKGCPSCGAIVAFKVIRKPRVWQLECPRCAHTWPMRKRAG